MPRPERRLFPELDPLHAFAQRLRDARQAAGSPTYGAMARKTGKSSTALSEAAGGDHLPKWDTVEAYLLHCREDPGTYLLDWEQVRDLREGATGPAPPREISALSNPPRRPASVFSGRSGALEDMDRLLAAGEPGIGVALFGLGGVGKTELTLHYLDRARSRYASMWWVTADTAENLTNDLASFTRAVQPDWPAAGAADAAAAWALRWFAAHDGWLLVLDNVADPGMIAATLAAATRGRVIVTSRRELDWGALGLAPLRVGVLDRDAGIEMLLERTARHDEEAELGGLAGDLADLPLALTHAGAYLVERGHVPVAEYRRRLAEQPVTVLGRRALAHPADDPVTRTWLLTIEEMQGENDLAVELLGTMAYLAPDAVPIEVLTALGADSVDIDDALAVAASYSLVTRSLQDVSVHRLVQTVVRVHQADRADHRRRAAADLLLAALPQGDPESTVASWPRWVQLVPHIEAVAGFLAQPPVLSADLAARSSDLLGNCGLYQRGQGRYDSALRLLRQAADMLHQIVGPDHPDTVTARYRLAGGLWSAGQFPEAMAMGESTWHTRRRLLGEHHRDTLANASYVALGYRELGRHEDALTLTVETLRARERVLGVDHPETLQSRNNLAGCYRAVGRHDEALPLYESTLADRVRMLGPAHPDTLQSRHNLGGGYLAAGRCAEAIVAYESTSVSRAEVLGTDHPDTLHTRHVLAAAYRSSGDPAKAVPLLETTLRSRRRILGLAHPDTLKTEVALEEIRQGKE